MPGESAVKHRSRYSAKSIQYEMSDRTHAISCGGIGAMHQVVQAVGLIDAINGRLSILKRRRPYSEADHILNIACNVLCGGYACNRNIIGCACLHRQKVQGRGAIPAVVRRKLAKLE